MKSSRQQDENVFKKLMLDEYKWLSCNEVDLKIDLIGHGLMAHACARPRRNVIILTETRIEWKLVACLRISNPVVTLYATLAKDGIIHGINDTEATHLITSHDLTPKIAEFIHHIPLLTTIIYMKNHVATVLAMVPEALRGRRRAAQSRCRAAEDVAIIMYISRSIGVPKGAMITKGNS
ncbi:hypothetical protein HPB48_021673 [Haemaphysalis longicornis]|uniref:long-chain-fatty-acid--CoA ligase n=1 Tax=Haemaphysalis longicornis TaxID=44386 RepID=A0A9J6GBR0_HAELO|nr:hypothetical protein HPB48_021673 [Haemaphysalis longicornis]